MIARPRLDELLGSLVATHRVTVVCAPAGFGKTLALRSWASRPGVLVIDDLNGPLDGAATDAIRQAVISGPPAPRVVLAGRSPSPFPLARLGLSEGVGFVGPEQLAFTVEEIVDLAAAAGMPLSPDAATSMWNESEGWPAAVRIALDARRRPCASSASAADRSPLLTVSLTAYVTEEVLHELPGDLADFVLRASICDEVDGELAALLWGDPNGATMLQHCVEHGVFLSRRDRRRGGATHRWNPAFAAACRASLADRHPDLVRELRRRVAGAQRSVAPAHAADLALRAGDPELAVAIVSEHWIQMMLESSAQSLEATCTALPLPWSERPETLLVRACCRRAASDDAGSERLRARARRRAEILDHSGRARFRVLSTYADLLLADDVTALAAASERAVATLAEQPEERPALHASVLFLAGFAEMRLRRDRDLAVSLLHDASVVCHANGLEALGHRATAYAAFVHAYWGEFETALALIAPGSEVAELGGPAIDGAIALTRGFVSYWRNELDAADVELREAFAALDEPPADASNVFLYLAFTAAARGGRPDLATGGRWLEQMAPDGMFGLPWGAYRRTAEALLAERRGDIERAAELARSVPWTEHTPVIDAMLAALLRRTGDRDGARRRIDQAGATEIPYVGAHLAVVESLLALDDGDVDAAHVALEQALDLAEPERAIRCLCENLAELRPLLDEHASWGTAHEQLVVVLLDDGGRRAAPGRLGPLSRRELEILGYMRTRMTANDIADALFISVATVRTHQRAIYRKLGVANRREALEAALALSRASGH